MFKRWPYASEDSRNRYENSQNNCNGKVSGFTLIKWGLPMLRYLFLSLYQQYLNLSIIESPIFMIYYQIIEYKDN